MQKLKLHYLIESNKSMEQNMKRTMNFVGQRTGKILKEALTKNGVNVKKGFLKFNQSQLKAYFDEIGVKTTYSKIGMVLSLNDKSIVLLHMDKPYVQGGEIKYDITYHIYE